MVVLSYNRPALLKRSLASIFAQTHQDLEVIVVDNPSASSAEIALVAGEFPGCLFFPQASNTGYTGGMNFGLAKASGEFILLTEDDMTLAPGSVEKFVRLGLERPKSLLSGVIDDGPTEETVFAGGKIDLTDRLHVSIHSDIKENEVYPTDYITGALVFSSARSWRDLGGFHSEFFMYMEDIELSIRAAKQGYELLIHPGIHALHWGGKKSNSRRDVSMHKLKNVIYVHRLHLGWRSTAWMLLRVVVGLRKGGLAEARCFAGAVGWHVKRILRGTASS